MSVAGVIVKPLPLTAQVKAGVVGFEGVNTALTSIPSVRLNDCVATGDVFKDIPVIGVVDVVVFIKLSNAKFIVVLEVPILDLEPVPDKVKVDVPLPVTVKPLRLISVPSFVSESELLQSPGHTGCLVIDRLPPPTFVIDIETGKVLLVLPNL